MRFKTDNHGIDDIPFKKTEIDSDFLLTLNNSYEIEFNGNNLQLIGNVNINSKNYFDGNYYIKVISNANNKFYALNLPKITDILGGLNITCAHFIKNNDQKYITYNKFEDKYFFVQEFIKGKYYNGNKEQFLQSINLLLKLKKFPINENLELKKSPFLVFAPEVLLPLLKTKLKIDNSSDFNKKIIKNIPYIKEMLNKLRSTLESLKSESSAIHHLDLHPHNLIFNGNQLAALVDLDSFKHIQPKICESFALYKLGRKSITNGSIQVEDFKELCSEQGFNLSELRPYVESELIRRIFLILDLHLLRDNSEWNADFSKHLNSLNEIELMFN